MPYICRENRAALDPMIEGLVKRLRDLKNFREEVRQAITNLAVYTQVINSHWDGVYKNVDPDVLRLLHSLGRRLLSLPCVRGDLNYTITRVVLETLRPKTGWSYHSLSDAIAVCNLAANKVIEMYGVDEIGAQNAISILRDVADEIKRRLLGPYEDKAIWKNGDMACFQEEFAPSTWARPTATEDLDVDWRGKCQGCANATPPSDIVDSLVYYQLDNTSNKEKETNGT